MYKELMWFYAILFLGGLILKHAVELLSFNQLRMLNDQVFLP